MKSKLELNGTPPFFPSAIMIELKYQQMDQGSLILELMVLWPHLFPLRLRRLNVNIKMFIKI